ncbi:MAG: flap structure-specific endonuclease [Theionarchaea archaeon DG-70]|nr:MAG: flap structure-specific endonuclease [Theionarchaea archaeon DG-70]
MGVQISGIIPKNEVELRDLAGRRVAIDAYNILFQFLSIIRQKDTGEPLRDSKGRITSHLSGIFYRTIKLMDSGIKPIYVYDGEPPEFKRRTIEEREEMREEAKKKWKEAVKEGRKEDIMVYAQGALKVTDEMLEGSKKVLDAMGIPWIQAPSEGEAQCAFMCRQGDADYSGSQDYDALLFSTPLLIRNLSITGKRKLPRQEAYIEIKPEIIELNEVLSSLEITKEQLIILGILVGTDYNPQGIKGIGPKTALKIVKENKTLDRVLKKVEWTFDVDPHKIYEFFLKPPVIKKYEINWKEPNLDKMIELMVEEHDFSRERIENALKRLTELKKEGTQLSLEGWFKK